MKRILSTIAATAALTLAPTMPALAEGEPAVSPTLPTLAGEPSAAPTPPTPAGEPQPTSPVDTTETVPPAGPVEVSYDMGFLTDRCEGDDFIVSDWTYVETVRLESEDQPLEDGVVIHKTEPVLVSEDREPGGCEAVNQDDETEAPDIDDEAAAPDEAAPPAAVSAPRGPVKSSKPAKQQRAIAGVWVDVDA